MINKRFEFNCPISFKKKELGKMTSTVLGPGEFWRKWLLVKSKSNRHIFSNNSILHDNFKSLALAVSERKKKLFDKTMPRNAEKGNILNSYYQKIIRETVVNRKVPEDAKPSWLLKKKRKYKWILFVFNFFYIFAYIWNW